MTFDITLMRPGGGFIAGVSTVAAAQLNYITASLANALDPIGGGTFTNTAGTQIILNGDRGFKFDYSAGPGLEIAGTVGASILNGSFLTVDLGGTIAFATGSMLDGSAIVTLALEATSRISGQVEWDATIVTGSTWLHQTGTTHTYDTGAVQLINGTLTINAGGAFVVTGSHTAQTGSVTTYESGAALTTESGATTTHEGIVIHSGTEGRTARRFSPVLADADQTIDTTFDFYRFATPGAARTIQLRVSSSPVPVAGEVIEVSRPAAGANNIVIYNEGALINAIVTLNASTFGTARFAFTGSAWALIGFSTNAVPGPAA